MRIQDLSIPFMALVTLVIACQTTSWSAPTNNQVPRRTRAQQYFQAGRLTDHLVNVKAFGAVGDGITDDTDAIRRALAFAGFADRREALNPRAVRPGQVFFPAGHYRVTSTIELRGPLQKQIRLLGDGGVTTFGAAPEEGRKDGPFARSQIIYDGPEGGVLIDCTAIQGTEFSHLALLGSGKARTLLRLNKTGRLRFEKVMFYDAEYGVEVGAQINANGDTTTFEDCYFRNLNTGFKTVAPMNLTFLFIRCDMHSAEIGWHFERGGSMQLLSCFAQKVATVVQIDQGGITGTYYIGSMKVEHIVDRKGHREGSTVLKARGDTLVKFDSLAMAGHQSDSRNYANERPAFELGPSASVVVTASKITGKVARLTSDPDRLPTWIQFDNCRFRINSDPRKIECDQNSGFELRNCMVVVDERYFDDTEQDARKAKRYQIYHRGLITHFRREPSNILLPDQTHEFTAGAGSLTRPPR